MKTKTGILSSLGLFGVVIGLTIFENTGPTRRDCEIYQGHTWGETSVNYVFDPESPDTRAGFPRHSLEGNPALKDSLTIGEKYCFDYKESRLFGSGKLISISHAGEPKNPER